MVGVAGQGSKGQVGEIFESIMFLYTNLYICLQ